MLDYLWFSSTYALNIRIYFCIRGITRNLRTLYDSLVSKAFKVTRQCAYTGGIKLVIGLFTQLAANERFTGGYITFVRNEVACMHENDEAALYTLGESLFCNTTIARIFFDALLQCILRKWKPLASYLLQAPCCKRMQF